MQFFSRYKQLLPTLLLACLSAWTAFSILTTSIVSGNNITTYNFTSPHYAAFAAILVCLLTFFFLRKVYKYVLGITLLLGIFSVLNFTVSAYAVHLALGALSVTFNPVAALVGILTLALNWKQVTTYLRTKSKPSKEEIESDFTDDVAEYKTRYQHASIDDLRRIVNDTRFKPGAVEAARQLLDEKKQ